MVTQQHLAAEQRQEQADALRRIEDQRIEERARLQQLLAQFAPGRAPPEPPDPEPGQGQGQNRGRNHNNRGNNNAPREVRRSSMSQFLEEADLVPALAVQEFVPHPKVPATFKEVEVGVYGVRGDSYCPRPAQRYQNQSCFNPRVSCCRGDRPVQVSSALRSGALRGPSHGSIQSAAVPSMRYDTGSSEWSPVLRGAQGQHP